MFTHAYHLMNAKLLFMDNANKSRDILGFDFDN